MAELLSLSGLCRNYNQVNRFSSAGEPSGIAAPYWPLNGSAVQYQQKDSICIKLDLG